MQPFPAVIPGVANEQTAPADVLAATDPVANAGLTQHKALELIVDNNALLYGVVTSVLRMFRCASCSLAPRGSLPPGRVQPSFVRSHAAGGIAPLTS